MRLVSFSVENYRSITKAKRIDISDATVLVGPNNEGKSNLVRGLAISDPSAYASVLTLMISTGHLLRTMDSRAGYSWNRDFPMQLREKESSGRPVFEAGETSNWKLRRSRSSQARR